MHMMKSALLCASVAIALAAAGCGAREKGAEATPTPAATSSATVPASPTPVPTPSEGKEAVVQSFYGNADASALIEKDSTIRFAKEEDKYLAVLNTLKKSPSQDAFSLCAHTSFLSAKLDAGKLTVNLSIPDEDKLGSDGEGLLLDAFRKTLFQFKEVDTFEILVDGKKPESLMGHYDLPPLFKR